MAVTKLMTLIQQCLLRRISVNELGRLLHTYQADLNGAQLASALIECRESFCAKGDPLISQYLEHVGTSGLVRVSDAIAALVFRWNKTKNPKANQVLDCYTQTLQDITMIIVSPKYKTDPSQARLCLNLSSKWLGALSNYVSNSTADGSTQEHNYVLEALAFLLASLAATETGLQALSQTVQSEDNSENDRSRNLRTTVTQAIDECLTLHPTMSPQLVERLNTIVKHISMIGDSPSQTEHSSSQVAEMQALQFQVSVTESQIIASKAATTTYLKTMLYTGTTIDDNVLLNFLSSRHQSDYQSMFVDIFTAAYHALSYQSSTNQSFLFTEQCKAFIENKLPGVLSMISASSFNSFSTEQALTDAWHQTSPLLANQESLLIGVRCLHACSLHHLITTQTAGQLSGSEELATCLSKGLYAKDDLVTQVISNHARGLKLVEELVRSDGSAGSISQAIVEIMHSYCSSKETQYLKDLANAILRKPSSINFIALFIRPAYWLGPLCALLDDWRWDEIHGEAQPIYDEFGAVFLLVLVTRARLGLSKSDLGIRKKDGFLAEYLEREFCEYALGELSQDRVNKLGEWINALYIAEGLSDELFTNCSPHDFYLLIPTLLRQSVLAHQLGKLSLDSLNAGLDYLLEPFLLPSLMPAFNWVGGLVDSSPSLAGIVLQVLTKSPSSTDSQDIHRTILAKAAPSLKKRLETSHHQDRNLELALEALRQCPEFSFGVEVITEIPIVGLLPSLQNSITLMLTSIAPLDIDSHSSLAYSPSLMMTAICGKGPDMTLRALIGVLLQLSDSHNFLFALDLIATIICLSPDDLRNALRIQYITLSNLLRKGESLSAEAVVRLYRQVETYTNILTVQDMSLDPFAFAHQMTNIDTANANLDTITAGQNTAMDLETDPGQEADGIDQVLDEVAAMGGLDNTMESNDADLSFDALYGLQSADMGLEDLNDLDLDMF